MKKSKNKLFLVLIIVFFIYGNQYGYSKTISEYDKKEIKELKAKVLEYVNILEPVTRETLNYIPVESACVTENHPYEGNVTADPLVYLMLEVYRITGDGVPRLDPTVSQNIYKSKILNYSLKKIPETVAHRSENVAYVTVQTTITRFNKTIEVKKRNLIFVKDTTEHDKKDDYKYGYRAYGLSFKPNNCTKEYL